MNLKLRQLADRLQLNDPQCDQLRFQFALCCGRRVQHLLLDQQLTSMLELAQGQLNSGVDPRNLQSCADQAKALAASQAGTNGRDGSGSAAVSASYAVARAIAGDAIGTAEYAAYALVYSYSSSAVSNPEAYEDEYFWQVQKLLAMSDGNSDISGRNL